MNSASGVLAQVAEGDGKRGRGDGEEEGGGGGDSGRWNCAAVEEEAGEALAAERHRRCAC